MPAIELDPKMSVNYFQRKISVWEAAKGSDFTRNCSELTSLKLQRNSEPFVCEIYWMGRRI